jgi:hippurate hydrolase
MQPRYASSLAIAFLTLLVHAACAADPRPWVTANLESLIQLYRHLHQTPELSLHEEKTAARMAQELKAAGAEVQTGVGSHGVVGLLKNGDGPTVMVRCDLDALPVTEETQLVYASKVRVKDDKGAETGVMHACGHDIHMTNLVGVARYLAQHKDQWKGTAMFVCQPAEERGEGARKMLNAGLFTTIKKPDYAMALHCDSRTPTGKVAYRAGYALANVDSVDITLRGRGGHGAYPHTTIDPIVLAAKLILDLQTIVSREVKPTESCVITVGSIHSGTKHNIISDTCHLELTVRSYTHEVRKQLLEGIKRKANAVAAGANAPEPTVTVSEGTPAMFNDEELVARVLPTLQKTVGKEHVVPAEPSMGGEDFSEYGRAGVPSFMFWLGSVDEKRLASYKRLNQEPPSLHSPVFYPDAEPALTTGVTAMTAVVLDLLQPKK